MFKNKKIILYAGFALTFIVIIFATQSLLMLR